MRLTQKFDIWNGRLQKIARNVDDGKFPPSLANDLRRLADDIKLAGDRFAHLLAYGRDYE